MITIVDYGVGNVRAFSNVFLDLNVPFKIATSAADLREATKLLVPGVGSFDISIERLQNSPVFDTVSRLVTEVNVPTLGVCIGMQMFADSSEEGASNGLGWIGGCVRKISYPKSNTALPLPHMGWNSIVANSSPLFESLTSEDEFYFLHSYFFDCSERQNCAAIVEYGLPMPCVVQKDNVIGVQFHPEKSHKSGATLLYNFATRDIC